MPKRKISGSEENDYKDNSSGDVEETEASVSESESGEEKSKYTKKKQKVCDDRY